MFDHPEIHTHVTRTARESGGVAPTRPDLARAQYLARRRARLEDEDKAQREAPLRRGWAIAYGILVRLFRTPLRWLSSKPAVGE